MSYEKSQIKLAKKLKQSPVKQKTVLLIILFLIFTSYVGTLSYQTQVILGLIVMILTGAPSIIEKVYKMIH